MNSLSLREMPLRYLDSHLEDRHVMIARARAVYTFPAHFILAAAMNPCPCGYYGAETETNACICSPAKIVHYRSKISGPLLDRIDLHVEVPKPSYAQLKDTTSNLSSATKCEIRLCKHIDRQQERYANTDIQHNNELSGRLMREICRLTPEGDQLLRASFEALGLSARAHDRILRLALTISDLEGCDHILPSHLAEAIQYRNLDKNQRIEEIEI